MMEEEWRCLRGDIYLADLGEPEGSIQGGVRPIVIVQNNKASRYSPTITYVPLTSRLKKRELPTHYLIRKAPGLNKPSMVQAEQIGTKNRNCLIRYLGKVDGRQMRRVDRAIMVHLFLRRYCSGAEQARDRKPGMRRRRRKRPR